MKFFYSDTFDLKLPPGHRFPGNKYGMLRKTLLEKNILQEHQLIASPLAGDDILHRAHDPAYVASMDEGTIDAKAMRRIGFPWSSHVARRARATMGGAVEAAKAALEHGVSGQLAGGTHHAHYDFGSGYCIYNDFACAALTLLDENFAQRIAIIDLDVHQGDGNAAILGGRKDVFVFSMHGDKNFPFRKEASDLDVALADGTGDSNYLDALQDSLPAIWAFKPDIVLYQAGVDPLAEDKLGRMNLTYEGLMRRDEIMLSECKQRGVPVSMAIGGGYANPIELSVKAYANTYRVAKSAFGF